MPIPAIRGLPHVAGSDSGSGDRAARTDVPPKNAIAGLRSTICRWFARSRQRRALREIAERDGYLLKDIGVSPEEAFREANKPFWQP